MINPNGLYRHVPSHATEFELALALIFKTGSTLLVHHWQPGGLDNHCLYDRHQASTISTGPLARRLFVAVGPVRASDMQLLLARMGHNFFPPPNHVLYVGPYVGF